MTIIFSVCLKNTYLLSATGSIVPVESAAMRSTLLETRILDQARLDNERARSFRIQSIVQGSAKRWSLGCVNLPPAARGSLEAEITQPRATLLADPCSKRLPPSTMTALPDARTAEDGGLVVVARLRSEPTATVLLIIIRFAPTWSFPAPRVLQARSPRLNDFAHKERDEETPSQHPSSHLLTFFPY